jgi:DNA-binding NarL/FixJ family response regulator
MKPVRILLVDDHAVVRAGLRALLQGITGAEVIGEAADGEAALALASRLHPDIVIMDIALPKMNGLDATALLKQDRPGTRVIILSMHNTKEYVLQALNAGASAYLLKDSAPVELELALQAVSRGDAYLSPAVSNKLIEHSLLKQQEGAAPSLTPRQREVLLLIARGHSTKDIAHHLNVSVKTVETHRMRLMQRLSINDIAGLVRYAIRSGLIRADE